MNRLAKETSPYLQQHKDNPINWFPYGEEAFEKAKAENKPIFLSIGYSSCHWCHVMARESFEDEKTAKYMNENFISIKIDREEYPGIDKAYQEMYQLINRRGGGWPLSVFALPDGAPFVLATYIPKESKYGMKSFMTVCEEIVTLWNKESSSIVQQANAIMGGLNQYIDYVKRNPDKLELSDDLIINQIQALRKKFDFKYGGFGPAPKFPRISTLRFLLMEGMKRKDNSLIDFVRFSFHKMALGGIYDQLGGGFARYSVDVKWLVPHFEKMLYDNAGFILLGAELHAATGDKYSKWVVYDTLTWVAREMRSKYGGFYSTLNAESEGREGKFYVWTKKELQVILKEDYYLAELRFGITDRGNFKDPHHPEIKGMNILSVVKDISEIVTETKLKEDIVVKKLNDIRQTLFAERGKRIPPSRDTKIITSWNALMITALLTASEKLDLPEAKTLAINALEFILETMLKEDRLIHSFHDIDEDQQYREIEGVLDDYALVIQALIKAFEFTDNWEYIEQAAKLEKLTEGYFFDSNDLAYYVNRKQDGSLFNKVIQVSDESMVSGFAIMLDNLFKLGKYTENDSLIERGNKILKQYVGGFNDFPGSMNGFMISASNYIYYPTEIVLVETNETDIDKRVNELYSPHSLIYRWNKVNKEDGREKWSVLDARTSVERPTIYICQGMTCSLPITDITGLNEEMERINYIVE